jgi:hypothetical protein
MSLFTESTNGYTSQFSEMQFAGVEAHVLDKKKYNLILKWAINCIDESNTV